MSGRAKVMGAGFAGSTKSNVNVNMNTAGGFKKQGLVSRVGLNNWSNLSVQTHANGSVKGRSTIFHMNQLGGIGRGQSQFMVAGSFAKKRGVKRVMPFLFVK
jgi:hypothetical protein